MPKILYQSHSLEKTSEGISGSLTVWENSPVSPFDVGDTFTPVQGSPTLTVEKVSIKIHSLAIVPVLAICPVGNNLPSYPNAGDIYLEYDGRNYSGTFYTSVTGSSWDTYRNVQKGDRYASFTDFKIYEFKEQYEVIFPIDIPIGVPFLNKADNSLYVYDGTQFVKT